MKLSGRQGMSGFTLMEMLTAIFVVFVLAGIAMPHFTRLLPSIRVASAARQVATDLQLARMRAISQRTIQTVVFDTATATYTFGADTRNLTQLYPGTTVAIDPVNPSFTTVGTAVAATTITVTNNGLTKQVQVNALGRVKIP